MLIFLISGWFSFCLTFMAILYIFMSFMTVFLASLSICCCFWPFYVVLSVLHLCSHFVPLCGFSLYMCLVLDVVGFHIFADFFCLSGCFASHDCFVSLSVSSLCIFTSLLGGL